MLKKHYDYIICRGGASGLILTNSIVDDNYFLNKKIYSNFKKKYNYLQNLLIFLSFPCLLKSSPIFP